MALVTKLERLSMERNKVHDPVQATYCIFQSEDGQTYLQIDTYGSEHRKFRGKKSQTIQFGTDAQKHLGRILSEL